MEIEKTVQDLKSRISKQEELSKETTKKTQTENKELKKGQDTINDEILELKRIHEETLDQTAILEMHQRELILCFRGIPDIEN